jgi:hypothetical protein
VHLQRDNCGLAAAAAAAAAAAGIAAADIAGAGSCSHLPRLHLLLMSELSRCLCMKDVTVLLFLNFWTFLTLHVCGLQTSATLPSQNTLSKQAAFCVKPCCFHYTTALLLMLMLPLLLLLLLLQVPQLCWCLLPLTAA